MSHITYQTKWTSCMQELMEQVQIEYLPSNCQEDGQVVENCGFLHPAILYLKYLTIYKRLEDCLDQMVHPQKRRSITKVLKSTIIRILELKDHLIKNNTIPGFRFVALDDVLADMRMNPESAEWQVPRFLLDDKGCKEDIEEKQRKLDHYLTMLNMSTEPDPLMDKKDPFSPGLTLDAAIEIIQKNERGRCGIESACMLIELKRETWRQEVRRRHEDGNTDLESEQCRAQNEVLAATRIAAFWRRQAERKHFLRLQKEEFEFLGMAPPHNFKSVAIREMEAHAEERRKSQREAMREYKKEMQVQEKYLRKSRSSSMKTSLLEERRQWILDYRKASENGGKFPVDIIDFYSRFDEQPGELDNASKSKLAMSTAKDEKKKKDGKRDLAEKLKEVDEEKPCEVGPSRTVQVLLEEIADYTEVWEGRDESKNFEQMHDLELVRKDVYPKVISDLRVEVDNMMREELSNLKIMFEKVKKKKSKVVKQSKRQCKMKLANKCGTADGKVVDPDDCFADLVVQCILKKILPCRIQDFWGESNYLGAAYRKHLDERAPSAQMIRSLLVEHCMLPLAAGEIRRHTPEAITARSLLLYGPKGSGKSMLARAIATEIGATFFDISPSVIGTCTSRLISRVLTCATANAPSVIYIDNVEQVFQQAKKKRARAEIDLPSCIRKDLQTAIEQVKVGEESTEQDRILFIGCTSEPFADGVDKAGLLQAFDEMVWLSCPDYSSRVLLWQRFIEECGVFADFTVLNVSTLASVSEGYSAGSIKQTVLRVLTPWRLQQLKSRPLKVQDFLGPLSRTAFCWPETYKSFRDFDHEVSGVGKVEADRKWSEEEQRKMEAAKHKGRRRLRISTSAN